MSDNTRDLLAPILDALHRATLRKAEAEAREAEAKADMAELSLKKQGEYMDALIASVRTKGGGDEPWKH